MSDREIKTTGQLRSMLADAAKRVFDGKMDIDSANVLHKLATNISDSLYSETKIAMFTNDIGKEVSEMGSLQLGDPNDDEQNT